MRYQLFNFTYLPGLGDPTSETFEQYQRRLCLEVRQSTCVCRQYPFLLLRRSRIVLKRRLLAGGVDECIRLSVASLLLSLRAFLQAWFLGGQRCVRVSLCNYGAGLQNVCHQMSQNYRAGLQNVLWGLCWPAPHGPSTVCDRLRSTGDRHTVGSGLTAAPAQ